MISNAGRKRRLIAMFTLTFIYMVVEVVIGVKFHCTSLLADAFHMLSDVIALTVGYISITLSPKAWKRSTFGWARAEVLGALINGVFLLALCFSLLIRAIEGFISPALMDKPFWVLIVGIGGLCMNLLGLAIFHEGGGHGHSHGNASNKKPSKGKGDDTIHPRRGSLLKHRGRLTRMAAPPVSSDSDLHPQSSLILPAQPSASPSKDSSSHTVANRDSAHTSISVQLENQSSNVSAVNRKDGENDEDGSKDKKNMNMKGVYLHLIADTLGSVVVVIVASVVYFTEKKRVAAQVKGEDVMPWKLILYLDPCLTVFMVTLVSCSTVPLVQEASLILLQTIPSNINVDKLKKKLLKTVDGVLGIHEFHVWQLAGDRIVGSIHIRFRDISQYLSSVRAVKDFFHHNGIHSITVQAEFQTPSQTIFGPDQQNEAEKCLLLCLPESKGAPLPCASSTCCGPQEEAK